MYFLNENVKPKHPAKGIKHEFAHPATNLQKIQSICTTNIQSRKPRLRASLQTKGSDSLIHKV